MATTVQDGQVQAQPVKKKRIGSIRGFINSPYLFILAPLLIGGFYLVQHPELVQMGVNNPYAVAFVGSLPVCLIAIKLIINFFSVIEQWIRLQFEKARQARKGFFFEIVTIVFMFVSVCEAGPFFNDIQHSMLSGALGYITVLAFDLIAVVCIDARRKELAKGGTRSGIYLLGVIICALVSMAANLYSALQNFHVPADPSIPAFLKSVAPYIGIMFPVMIIFLAFSRDADIEIDDAETYRKQQQKRVDFLVVRREILARVTHEMEQIDLLGKREFILKSWLFTRKKMDLVVEIMTTKMQSVLQDEVGALKKEIAEKERVISSQFEAMKNLVEQVNTQRIMIDRQVEKMAAFQGQASEIDYQKIVPFLLPFLNDFRALVSTEIAQKMQENLPEIDYQKVAALVVPEPINYDQILAKITPIFEAKMKSWQPVSHEESHTPGTSSQLWVPTRPERQQTTSIVDKTGRNLREVTTDPEMPVVAKTSTISTTKKSSGDDGKTESESATKSLIGLPLKETVKLPICQRKNITLSDLKAAVKSGDLKAKSDGSFAQSAVEKWARSYQKVAASA